MQHRHLFFVTVLYLILPSLHLNSTIAAEPVRSSPSSKNFEFITTVNGIPISKGLLELNVQAAKAQGQKDSPQLRGMVKNELINRELIAQEVLRQGLDKEINLEDQITQLRHNLYLQAFIEERLKSHPITVESLRAEYRRQQQYLGNGADSAAPI